MTLDRIMRPRSVAVIGASRSATKRGYQTIRTLLDDRYEGPIYPVNPKERSILGLTCYPNLNAIDGPVDMALIATPAASVPGILRECASKAVSGVVVLAGGFREAGEKGRALEQEVVRLAREHRIRIIGPNTSGMMSLVDSFNLVGIRDAPKGDIALLSQSGNMALSLMTEARIKSRKGFSYYVGVGNEADIKFHEYLEFFRQDSHTRAVLMYVEGMRAGREFLQQAYLTTQEKPIILLKSGRSSTGQKSAGSHTGALAGMSEVARGAFERAGIVVIEKSDELFAVAETLSCCPPIKKRQVAILADGGGHATIAADILSDNGVELPELSEVTQEKLRQILPAAASVSNPVDVAGGTDADPSLFADCVRIILKDSNIGGLLVVGLFGGYGIRFDASLALMEEDAAHRMGKMVSKFHKPIVIHSLYNSERPHPLELCRYYNIPVYDSVDVACRCISSLAQYGAYLKSYHAKTDFVLNWSAKARPEGEAIISQARQEGRKALLEHEAKRLLQIHGGHVTEDRLAASEEEAAEHAAAIQGPVVLKIVSPDILHKSDAQGVKLNLKSKSDVRRAYRDIMKQARAFNAEADLRGVLVGPMVGRGVEVIIGTKVDAQFGPVIMYGLGGVMVEILKDVSFRVLPISRRSARLMIDETKSAPILNGVRGNAGYDKKALTNLLLTTSDLIQAYPDIEELDMNPVIVHEQGLTILDARIILREKCSDDKEIDQRRPCDIAIKA